MYRLSLIISEIYNKYLPLAQKDGIALNLDFSDTTKEISDPERIKQYLDENLGSALKRSDKGDIAINVDGTAITITDSGTTLSKAACALLSNRHIEVKSRIGFGTTVKIFFLPQETPSTSDTSAKTKPQIEGAGLSIELDNTEKTPTIETTGKIAVKQGKRKTRLGAKLRLQRSNKLRTAAKKADKEVKRIAKKAQKTSKAKASVTRHKTTKQPKLPKSNKKTKKTTRKLEVS